MENEGKNSSFNRRKIERKHRLLCVTYIILFYVAMHFFIRFVCKMTSILAESHFKMNCCFWRLTVGIWIYVRCGNERKMKVKRLVHCTFQTLQTFSSISMFEMQFGVVHFQLQNNTKKKKNVGKYWKTIQIPGGIFNFVI